MRKGPGAGTRSRPLARRTTRTTGGAKSRLVNLRGDLLLRVLPALQSRKPDRIDVSQGTLDVRGFFHGSTPEERVRIIERYDADYVMVREGSPLNETFGSRPGFTPVYTAAGGYSLYAVDRDG